MSNTQRALNLGRVATAETTVAKHSGGSVGTERAAGKRERERDRAARSAQRRYFGTENTLTGSNKQTDNGTDKKQSSSWALGGGLYGRA